MKHIKLIIGVLGIAFTMQAQSITLEECKKMAKENNYSLRNSYLDQQISNQNRKEAFTNYFPKIDASAAYLKANKGLLELQMPNPLTGEASALSLIEKGKTASVSLMQPIFMGGQIFNGNKLAKIGENVSNLQYKLTSDEVERRTELYFWQIVQLKEKLKTISDMEALLKTINQDVQNAIKAGLSTRNDLLRVELQQYEIELNKIKIENGLNTSKLLLSQLVGFEKEDFDLEYNSIEDLGSPFDLYVDAADAVSRSTEAGLLSYNVEANKLQKKLQVGKLLPSVAVGGTYVYHDMMGDDFNAGALMVNVSVPLTDWWGGSHAIKKQSLEIQKAENERQNNMELLVVKTKQCWNELQEAYKQILISQKSIDLSQENMRMNRNSYQIGIITLSDLLESQSLLQQSMDKYIESYTNYQIKVTEYKLQTSQN